MKQMLEKWGEGGLFVSEDREVPAHLLSRERAEGKKWRRKGWGVRSGVCEKRWDSGHTWNA